MASTRESTLEELDLSAAEGFIEPGVAAEFPGLRLDWVTVAARDRPSPTGVVGRLMALSNRYRGNTVVAMRTHPIPRAYRSFFRQIGLDPDTSRIPAEKAALSRLLHGGFISSGLAKDALLISLIETGVPVWALDADRVGEGGPGIRTSVAGERLGTTELGDHLAPGRLVVADAASVHGLLFGEVAPGHGVAKTTRRIVLFSVGVEGVPSIHIEEALWISAEVLKSG
jgi:DNA/RNA-binding domain of Phe-tRNA-synthetase-like protein